MIMDKRVVVTGMGIVSPVGNNVETYWENLKKGVNGIKKLTRFDTEGLAASVAGEITDREQLFSVLFIFCADIGIELGEVAFDIVVSTVGRDRTDHAV